MAQQQLTVVQRFSEFLRELVLEQINGRLVVFFDEIDSTISLDFTDDFFAAIRACYNDRANDDAFERLTFVLLGVASPSDLMRDTRRTPFNIGEGIELADFTLAEMTDLRLGLNVDEARGQSIVKRIFEWTSGHPYLTQKVASLLLAYEGKELDVGHVDEVVGEHLLSEHASQTELNLRFVKDRLTGHETVDR